MVVSDVWIDVVTIIIEVVLVVLVVDKVEDPVVALSLLDVHLLWYVRTTGATWCVTLLRVAVVTTIVETKRKKICKIKT